MPLRSLCLAVAVCAVAIPVAAEPILRAIVPVVGSTQGGFGSHFRTSLQLHNRTPREMRGTMLIRPAGALADEDNRSLPYVLAPHETIWFEDVVASAGVEGLGSLDFVVEQGGVPTIVARAYDDQGEEGTAGVSIRPVAPSEALSAGELASLIAPSDLTRFRFNIGLRTLGEGVRMNVVVYEANGTIAAHLGQRTYGPHAFLQQPSAAFLGGLVLSANQSVVLEVIEGSVIVYATSTDNITNDPSLQIARSVEE